MAMSKLTMAEISMTKTNELNDLTNGRLMQESSLTFCMLLDFIGFNGVDQRESNPVATMRVLRLNIKMAMSKLTMAEISMTKAFNHKYMRLDWAAKETTHVLKSL
ncbi:hypothetical protein CAPTEDRAFT_204219 [Capitella teleta]|uniref:Uncharacterized protein n=1 Tax=Capitella teleta TaxID=283909 RepID=R7US81_CAPTE|nr:hypothetical protein CAPTEDRAFT_204219 [Capitella teleta]|eukprot:ELU06777.1 hypothetical protein CAPTEDRAFT_204219 [Capitella teleta]